ncbi:MAG: hypothetical protein FWH07_01095 [Oscillospiraceae bacterium]|nr:hypothetical protein [Oscillospiraceae bacterium]
MSKSSKRNKALRREAALKKSRRNKILIVLACLLVAAGIVAFIFIQNAVRGKAEIYSAGGQSVHLYENGNFTANMSHGANKKGTYTKSSEDAEGRVSVYFKVANSTVEGVIEDGRLSLPTEWDDGHGHGSVLTKTN